MVKDGKIDRDYLDVDTKRADVTFHEDWMESSDSEDLDPTERRERVREARLADSYRDGGNDAIDYIIDEEAVIEHDGRANTRTFWYDHDVPEEKKEQYQRLIKIQEGMFVTSKTVPSRKEQNSKADRDRWVQTLCTHLDMADTQRETVQHIVSGLNLKHMAFYCTETVILSAISLVANEQGRWIRDEEMFQKLCEAVETDLDGIKKCRNLVKRKSDYFDYDGE